MTISFDVSSADDAVIRKISRRARALEIKHGGPGRSLMDWQMDIIATHANGNPLRLTDLLEADDFNFAHDVFGICRHLDRNDSSLTAGQLNNHFRPRCSAPVAEEAA